MEIHTECSPYSVIKTVIQEKPKTQCVHLLNQLTSHTHNLQAFRRSFLLWKQQVLEIIKGLMLSKFLNYSQIPPCLLSVVDGMPILSKTWYDSTSQVEMILWHSMESTWVGDSLGTFNRIGSMFYVSRTHQNLHQTTNSYGRSIYCQLNRLNCV